MIQFSSLRFIVHVLAFKPGCGSNSPAQKDTFDKRASFKKSHRVIFMPITAPVDGYGLGVVQEPVENGAGSERFAQKFAPFPPSDGRWL